MKERETWGAAVRRSQGVGHDLMTGQQQVFSYIQIPESLVYLSMLLLMNT